MNDLAIEARGLVKKFPARPGTGDKPIEGGSTQGPKKKRWQIWKKEPKSMFTAVSGVDLQIQRGEIFGLLGPNGAGKSTTIRMLCTLLEPTSGTAKVHGFDVVQQANEVRRSLGTVLAGERSIYWKLTGRENLEYFAALYHIPQAIAKKRVDELLERMELRERANELVEKYSTGMRQRIAIAKALLARPPILLLDEPTLGLDPQAARNLRELIAQLKQEGHTILLTTHYMEEADLLSDRIGIIDTGKVIALDTPEGLKRRIEQKEVIRLEVTGWHDELGDKIKSISGIENLMTRQQGEADLWEINMQAENSR
ncbi:MAG: ABC transporter ATP-binding protein, partial [Anaerolineales bacterium]